MSMHDQVEGFPTSPLTAPCGRQVRGVILDGIASVEWLDEDAAEGEADTSTYYYVWGLDHDDRVLQMAAIALAPNTPRLWFEEVIPDLLETELTELDAIVRMRLAARLTGGAAA